MDMRGTARPVRAWATLPACHARRYSDEVALEDAIHTALLTLKEGFEGSLSGGNIEVCVARGGGAAAAAKMLPEEEGGGGMLQEQLESTHAAGAAGLCPTPAPAPAASPAPPARQPQPAPGLAAPCLSRRWASSEPI